MENVECEKDCVAIFVCAKVAPGNFRTFLLNFFYEFFSFNFFFYRDYFFLFR